ncbi:MAG: carbohydrate ABC transporter permease [Acutalibacter sp.]|nr:carbohydrate ABC transporter permease [Acutalibacter sp.]
MIGKRKFASIAADILIYAFLFFLAVITLYPVLYIISTSISDSVSVMKNEVILIPKGINFGAYQEILKNKSIWTGYANSLFLLFFGTAINVVMNICAAFPLSRKDFCFRKGFMLMIVFTMFFSGGMIPTYLVVDALHLTNSLWGLIIPTAVNAFNIIIMRSFFEGIPDSLAEAVKIDGGTDLNVLFQIYIPLSMPVIAVIALYYGVAHWNGFTQALIYIRNRELYPLQIILRELLLQNKAKDMVPSSDVSDMLGATRSIQYATIVVSIVPMLILYPFLQKYFVKGMTLGAVKG